MKTLSGTLLAFIFLMLSNCLTAQVVSSIKPDSTGKIGEFDEWKKATASFDDGTKATFEYRVGLMKRTGMGCHYEIEVRNTSEEKYEFKIESHYYDKFVKSYFGDKTKDKVKPGKIINAHFVAQGCKKEKGVERTDLQHCLACDFYINIFISK